MGGIHKENTIYGRDLKTAFRNLQKEEEEEYGNDIYSGGWNNASGVREVSCDDYIKIVEEGGPDKHESAIACCIRKPKLNKMKVKTAVISFPNKGTRKWITKYVADCNRGFEVVCELSQADAIKKARAYVDKNPDERLEVYITKKLETNAKVAEIHYKKAKNEADGGWDIAATLSY